MFVLRCVQARPRRLVRLATVRTGHVTGEPLRRPVTDRGQTCNKPFTSLNISQTALQHTLARPLASLNRPLTKPWHTFIKHSTGPEQTLRRTLADPCTRVPAGRAEDAAKTIADIKCCNLCGAPDMLTFSCVENVTCDITTEYKRTVFILVMCLFKLTKDL